MFVTKSAHEEALVKISQLESDLKNERSLREELEKQRSFQNDQYSLEFAALRLAISKHKPLDPASQLASIGRYGKRKILLLVEDSWRNLMEARNTVLGIHVSLKTDIPDILLAMDIEDALLFIESGKVDMVITDLGLHRRGISIEPKSILGGGEVLLENVNSIEEFVVGQTIRGHKIDILANCHVIEVLLYSIAKSTWKSVRAFRGSLLWEDMATPTLDGLSLLKPLDPGVHGTTPVSDKEAVYSLLCEALVEGLHGYSLEHRQVDTATLRNEVLTRADNGISWEAVPCAMGLLIVKECDRRNIPVVYHSALSHSESSLLVPVVVGDADKEEILQIHAKSRRKSQEEGGQLISLETKRGLLVLDKSPYWWIKAWEKLESLLPSVI